jgi:hypothetical protein
VAAGVVFVVFAVVAISTATTAAQATTSLAVLKTRLESDAIDKD